jgi:hypothetical protein
MKIQHGEGTCFYCQRICNDWVNISTLSQDFFGRLVLYKKIDICVDCLHKTEFIYIGDNNFVKYNIITNNYCSSLLEDIKKENNVK